MEHSRAASITLAVLLATLAIGVGWLAVSDLVELIEGARERASPLTVATGSAATLPAALALMLVAALAGVRTSDRWQRRLFGAALVCLPFALIAPVALYAAAERMLPPRGYVACDRPVAGARFLTKIWVRGSAGRCPA